MSDILKKICADKREYVDARKNEVTLDLNIAPPIRGFKAALQAKNDHPAVIAEIKKASPSKGVLREDFDPALHAKQYADAGATCLSVLTDIPYFQGHDDYLIAARAACDLPVLRKDFMIDPWQVTHARMIGADCVLIIMAAVDNALAQDLYDTARKHNMDVLIEVHDHDELERTLALNTPDAMIGVNNRNLKTLEISIQNGIDLIRNIPDDSFKIGESGIHSFDDLQSLQNAGYQAFLIGEAFMTKPDPGAALLTFFENRVRT